MKIINTDIFKDDEWVIEGKRVLEKGGVVVFPTETVYGIGALFSHPLSIDRIYQIKGRQHDKPFTYHFASLEAFFTFAGGGIDEKQKRFFCDLMSNPVTLIYFDSIRNKKIGVRIPTNDVAHKLLQSVSVPVLATSVNKAGEPAPSEFKDIQGDLLEQADLVLNSGSTEKKVASTVIDISQGTLEILRQGAFKVSSNKGE